jgi:predicted dehydrogenase
MTSLRTAVIGLGRMGTARADIAHAHEASQVVAVYDPRADLVETACRRYGAAVLPDPMAHPVGDGVDVVVLAAPNVVKDRLLERLVAQGKPILCEKPAAVSRASWEAITEQVVKFGTPLKIGFNYRYFDSVRKLREMVVGREVGEPINYRLAHGHGGRVDYERDWRFDRSVSGGGELLDQGCHAIDLACWLFGAPTVGAAMLQRGSWTDSSSVDDNAAVLLDHSGVLGSIQVSWTQWENIFRFEVACTAGTLTCTGLHGGYGPAVLTIGRREEPGKRPSVETMTFQDDARHTFEREWQEFVDAAADGKPPAAAWRTQAEQVVEAVDNLYTEAHWCAQRSQ